jgi:hypothetical protein
MRRTLTTLVALVVLAACGGPEAGDGQLAVTPNQRVAQAAAATRDTGSLRFTMKMKIENGPDGSQGAFTAEGASDLETKRSTMTMDVAVPGFLGTRVGGATQTMEMVSDGPVVFLKAPGLRESALPTPWLKIDIRKLSGAGKKQFSQFGATDLARGVEMLRGMAGDVTEAGTDDVRGVETTHYTLTIDPKKAVAQAPRKLRAAMREELRLLGGALIPTEAWVDEQGRLRRLQMTYDMSNALGASGGGALPPTGTLEMEMFDFGAAVDVQRPPKSEVTDIGDLLN